MGQPATNNQLLALEADIQQLSSSSPAFFFFNKEKIRRFYQQNAINLKIIQQKMAGFIEKYVVHDEKNQPKTEDKDGQTVYVFACEDDEFEYRNETSDFLNRSIFIEI